MEKKITFFYTDHLEKNTWKNLKRKAIERGFKTEFSKDLTKDAEIGFYNHDRNIKNKAKLSVISIHGMDQCRNLWPNPWINMRWDYYDVGLLPGKRWSRMWSKASFDPYAIPKKGVFNIGWPKSDSINSNKFKLQKNKIIKKLNPKKKTILYAPSMETDNKQLDILNLAIKLNVNLIIKHWPSKDDIRVSDIYKNILNANKISKKRYKDVIILPPKSDIFVSISAADLLITDESSVLYEAMLLNMPTIIPNDWKMRINNINKPRNIIPSKYAYTNCSNKELYSTSKLIFKNLKSINKKISKKKKFHFSNIGCSSEKILDLIEKILLNKDLSRIQIKPHYKLNKYHIFMKQVDIIKNLFIKFLKKIYSIIR